MFSPITLPPLVLLLVAGWSQGGPYYYRAPFTAFRPGQKLEVFRDVPGEYSFRSSKAVLPPRFSYSHSSRSAVAVAFKRLRSKYDRALLGAGSDLVSQTKAHAQGLINILKVLKTDTEAVDWVKQNIQDSPCISSLDDAISAAKAGLDIITSSESDLTSFLNTYTKLKDEKDVVVLMRGAAEMLQKMDSLIPQLATFPLSTQCRVKPEDSLQGIKDISALLTKIASSNSAIFPQSDLSTIERSASIVDSTATFLTSLRDVFKTSSLCNSDAEYSAKAVLALGDIFDQVADFLDSLGFEVDTSEIRENNLKFTTSLVDTIEKLRELDVGFLDCSQALSYKLTAESLLDVANIIEEIGQEELSNQLGISFSLEF